MIDLTQYTGIGALIGSAMATYVAGRALKKSTDNNTELAGPDNEPSLRQLIKDQAGALEAQGAAIIKLSADIKKDFGAVHGELDGVSQRIEKLERAVFSTLEQRLLKVEEFVFRRPPRKRRKP